MADPKKRTDFESDARPEQMGLGLFLKWFLFGISLCLLFALANDFFRMALAFVLCIWGMVGPFLLSFAMVDLSNRMFRYGKYGLAERSAALGLWLDGAVRPLVNLIGMPDSPFALFNSINMASCLLFRGRFKQAHDILLKALEQLRDLPELDRGLAPLVMSQLAGAQYMLGRFREAERTLNRASQLNESRLGEVDLSEIEKGSLKLALAADQYALGCLFDKLQEHRKSADRFEAAIEMLRNLPRSLDADGELEANFLNALGEQQLYLDEIDSARTNIERSLMIRQRLYGKNHPLIGSSLDCAGRLAMAQDDLAHADHCLKQALKVRERYAHLNPADLADTLVAMARLRQRQQLYDEAQELLDRALTYKKSVFGDSYPDVALVLESLSDLAGARGDAAGAGLWANQAKTIRENLN
ncbi:MAG: tetratricopeptide repeat protein [Candidatus Melainabacteria bacterium]|nr:tetratricopeptide repeat protein [Candidatus Melainabacteria bacterium]